MEPFSAAASLQLPVRLHGIQLGRPTDLVLDATSWRALGYIVHCGDETERFLPFAAGRTAADEIELGSALMLLEDVEFYRTRGTSLRAARGSELRRGRRPIGVLLDVLLDRDGTAAALEVERGARTMRVPADGTTLVTPSRSAA